MVRLTCVIGSDLCLECKEEGSESEGRVNVRCCQD